MTDEGIRAFFAADLDDAARRAAAGVARALRESSGGDAVRWVRPEALHVTLRFLGNIDPAQAPPLARAVGDRVAPLGPFEIQLGAARLFPSARRPRVVMIELAPAGPLEELAAAVEDGVVAAGFEPEGRRFRAHLTLGRLRGLRGRRGGALPQRAQAQRCGVHPARARSAARRRGSFNHESPLDHSEEREMAANVKGRGNGSAEAQKEKAIALAVSTIEKQFGKGAILKMTEDAIDREVQSFSSGAPSLDLALGVGGYPRGRVVEIYGPEASGKTTLALHAVAEVQRRGGVAAFVDAEHALDTGYARRLGVKVEDLLVSQPDTGEQALEIVDVLLRSGAIDLVVVDSVAALTPRAEIEGEMGDHHVGLQARLMSQALRKLTATVSKSNSTVIFINQIRMRIGVMFGNPETTTGGNALKFYSSMRLDVRRIAALKDGDEVIGNRTRVKVVKNKVAPPFRQAEFDILYNRGISLEGDILDLGVECGIVEKSGAWYSYDDERIGQGRENARRFLIENPDVRERLTQAVYEARGLKRAVPVSAEAPAEDESKGA